MCHRYKKVARKLIKSLNIEEIKAIINTPDTNTETGARDHFMLSLLYHTGARVQELCDIKIADVATGELPQVELTGKGKKKRIIPLQKETVSAMKHYLSFRDDSKTGEHLFLNSCKHPITRFGVTYIIKKHTKQAVTECPSLEKTSITPHIFRHTNALHLIQSGVDVLIVKEWLGHENLKTTMQYLSIDIEMKRKALTLFPAPVSDSANQKPIWKEPMIMTLLKNCCTA